MDFTMQEAESEIDWAQALKADRTRPESQLYHILLVWSWPGHLIDQSL